jgi:sterol 3beta-glucosyltransferase
LEEKYEKSKIFTSSFTDLRCLDFIHLVDRKKKAGQRGLLLSGWGGLKAFDLPKNVFAIERAPHDWLFPRMAGVVHHGGAGTTAAVLRAGKPMLITPFMGDQPFWGRRVYKLGLGPEPIPQTALTVEKLAAAIEKLANDPEMARRAVKIGEKIRAEDGIANAVDFIRKYVGDL